VTTAAFDEPFEPFEALGRLPPLGLLRELEEPLREPDAPLRELDALLRELDALLPELDALPRELAALPRELEAFAPEPDDELFEEARFDPLPFVALEPFELRLALLRFVPELAWAMFPSIGLIPALPICLPF